MMPPNSNDCDCGICNYCNGVTVTPVHQEMTHLGLNEVQWAMFENELTHLINRMSLESRCGNVPDFIIAQYLTDCLANYIRVNEKLLNWRKSSMSDFEYPPRLGYCTKHHSTTACKDCEIERLTAENQRLKEEL